VYSEGAFSWSEVWFLSSEERSLAATTVNDLARLKAGKGKQEFM
jgi:hypothetical protein